MIYILAFIVLIGVIVFVHELGHFWAARSVGVGVERFSVGMPPNFIDFTKTKNGLIIDQGKPNDLIKKHGRKNLEEVFLKLARN